MTGTGREGGRAPPRAKVKKGRCKLLPSLYLPSSLSSSRAGSPNNHRRLSRAVLSPHCLCRLDIILIIEALILSPVVVIFFCKFVILITKQEGYSVFESF